MKGTFELPDSTRRLAEALFLAIRAAFAAMSEDGTVLPHRAGAEPAPGTAPKAEMKINPTA
jgi:hypothetical protein